LPGSVERVRGGPAAVRGPRGEISRLAGVRKQSSNHSASTATDCPGTGIGIAAARRRNDLDTLPQYRLALYRAKGDGRGSQFLRGKPQRESPGAARDRKRLGQRSGGEFELYFQPLFDLKQRRISSFKALLRWNHRRADWSRRSNSFRLPKTPG
jgi:predicted signal transduction protein with EAL and GGDEF domain